MSHPFVEIGWAVGLVVAVGAGTILVLPRAKPEPPVQSIMLDVEGPPAVRAEPQQARSDAERVDDLQRQLNEVAAEQKRLANELRAAAKARAARGREAR